MVNWIKKVKRWRDQMYSTSLESRERYSIAHRKDKVVYIKADSPEYLREQLSIWNGFAYENDYEIRIEITYNLKENE